MFRLHETPQLLVFVRYLESFAIILYKGIQVLTIYRIINYEILNSLYNAKFLPSHLAGFDIKSCRTNETNEIKLI